MASNTGIRMRALCFLAGRCCGKGGSDEAIVRMDFEWALLVVPMAPVVSAPAQHGRGSGYYNGYHNTRPYDDRYDRDYYKRHHQGGIGPGTGALIGGGAGALLGGLIGGGMKGALIGGAVGAGGGALLGKANQDSKRHDWRDRY